ncbi:hypothetical protein LSAT2_026261 [Lamellibrachia satsuma]|nr:hypothetical protein LSAT2_026261 [Lamellibrachia satsuma]
MSKYTALHYIARSTTSTLPLDTAAPLLVAPSSTSLSLREPSLLELVSCLLVDNRLIAGERRKTLLRNTIYSNVAKKMTRLNVIIILVLCVCLEECWSRDLTVLDLTLCLSNCNKRNPRCKKDCRSRMKPVFAPCRDSCLDKWFGCVASCDKLGGDRMMGEAKATCRGYLKLCVKRCPKGSVSIPLGRTIAR